jgi:hypothetical protein
MEDIENLIYIDEIESTRAMPNAFMQVQKCINPNGYERQPMILEVLHMKRFTGDGIEDPNKHLDLFQEAC